MGWSHCAVVVDIASVVLGEADSLAGELGLGGVVACACWGRVCGEFGPWLSIE